MTNETPLPSLRNVPPHHQQAKHIDFSVLTLVDYDASFMRDRVTSYVYANGKQTGIYSSLAIPPALYSAQSASDFARYALEEYSAESERMVIDEFLGTGYKRQVRDLEANLGALRAEHDLLLAYVNRIRWWQVRRRVAQRRHERALRLEAEEA